MNEKTYRLVVVVLLAVVSVFSVIGPIKARKVSDVRIRDVFEMEFVIREKYREGYRLIVVVPLGSRDSNKGKSEYYMVFEK